MVASNSEPRVREKQQRLVLTNREKVVGGRIRFVLGSLLLMAVAVAGVLMPSPNKVWRVGAAEFSTADIAAKNNWSGLVAPVLAKNFDSVVITNLGRDELLGIGFDGLLAGLYGVEADYSSAPVDLRSSVSDTSKAQGRALASLMQNMGLVQHEIAVSCGAQLARECELLLVWRPGVALRPLPAQFTVVALRDDLYALIDRELIGELPQLGAAIESAEQRERSGS